MPLAMITKLAKSAGVSASKAEDIWKKAKAAAKGAKLKLGGTVPKAQSSWGPEHYRYVVGIFKKMIGKNESYGESMIDRVLSGTLDARSIIESLENDTPIRAFLDCGRVAFATPDDIVIEADSDPRLVFISSVVNDTDWPDSHPIYSVVDNYIGCISDLCNKMYEVTGITELVKPRKPRHKSLEQLKGYKQGSRTRMRHAESSGYLYHYYYKQKKRDEL